MHTCLKQSEDVKIKRAKSYSAIQLSKSKVAQMSDG